MIAVVILQRDIARIGRGGGNKLSNVRRFYHFAIGRGLNFLQYGNNRTNFFGKKKKGKMKLPGVSFLFFENTRKNLKLNVVPFLVLKSKALIPSNPQLYLH